MRRQSNTSLEKIDRPKNAEDEYTSAFLLVEEVGTDTFKRIGTGLANGRSCSNLARQLLLMLYDESVRDVDLYNSKKSEDKTFSIFPLKGCLHDSLPDIPASN